MLPTLSSLNYVPLVQGFRCQEFITWHLLPADFKLKMYKAQESVGRNPQEESLKSSYGSTLNQQEGPYSSLGLHDSALLYQNALQTSVPTTFPPRSYILLSSLHCTTHDTGSSWSCSKIMLSPLSAALFPSLFKAHLTYHHFGQVSHAYLELLLCQTPVALHICLL